MLGVSHAPTQRERDPRSPQFWGFPSIYAYMHCLPQNYQIRNGNTYGGGACILGSATHHPESADFQGSPLLGVLLYLRLHSLTQNDQIRHCNTWGGACF